MSYKARLIKFAISWTPKLLVIWIANLKLKGVAKLSDYLLNLDARKVYLQVRLFGEPEIIEVLVEGIAVVSDGRSYSLIMRQAQSNRPWLNNLLSRITGHAWKIPTIPQLTPYMSTIAELFNAEGSGR